MGEIPVIAAIPTYDMAQQAADLIEDVQKQGFDEIYVLDDKSSDNTIAILRERFGDSIKIIAGDKNLGAAGNRNRILGALLQADAIPETAIVFMDADTRIEPGNPLFAQEVRKLLKQYPDAGMIGGRVLNKDGSWGAFNYGPLVSLKYLLANVRQLQIENKSKKDPARAKAMRERHIKLLEGWPNPFQEPQPTSVGWLVETFTIVSYETFSRVGGYDPSLRYCEGLDMGEKMGRLGLKRMFDPSLTMRHLQIDNRGMRRYLEVLDAVAKLSIRKLFSKS